MHAGGVGQPGVGHDELVQAAPEVLVLVGAAQTLPREGEHQVVECVAGETFPELPYTQVVLHAFVGGVIVEIAGNQDLGARVAADERVHASAHHIGVFVPFGHGGGIAPVAGRPVVDEHVQRVARRELHHSIQDVAVAGERVEREDHRDFPTPQYPHATVAVEQCDIHPAAVGRVVMHIPVSALPQWRLVAQVFEYLFVFDLRKSDKPRRVTHSRRHNHLSNHGNLQIILFIGPVIAACRSKIIICLQTVVRWVKEVLHIVEHDSVKRGVGLRPADHTPYYAEYYDAHSFHLVFNLSRQIYNENQRKSRVL